MAHETSTGSSPIVKGLMNNLREILPDEQRPTLDQYTPQAEASSPKGDFKRARYCLHWAVKTAESPKHSHLSGLAIRLKETPQGLAGHLARNGIRLPRSRLAKARRRRRSRATRRSARARTSSCSGSRKRQTVAQSAAEKSGWENVPWEDLLQEVLKIS